MRTQADILAILETLPTRGYPNPSVFIGKSCQDVYSMMMFKSDGSEISVFGKFRQDLWNSGGFLPACSRCCSAMS